MRVDDLQTKTYRGKPGTYIVQCWKCKEHFVGEKGDVIGPCCGPTEYFADWSKDDLLWFFSFKHREDL